MCHDTDIFDSPNHPAIESIISIIGGRERVAEGGNGKNRKRLSKIRKSNGGKAKGEEGKI